MKMKRFFTNKHKKKKSHGSGESISDGIPSDLGDNNSSNAILCETIDNSTKAITKKKHNNRKKKLKYQASIDSDDLEADLDKTYLAPNGANVVLRRRAVDVAGSPSSSHKFQNYEGHDKRIPGSESSSRTPSSASASSSSSYRWSARRPWSLIDTLRGQGVDEFSELQRNDLPNDFSDVISDSPPTASVCTLPRGANADDTSNERNKNKTSSVDFSIFRRFKRLSTSSTQTTESISSATSVSPEEGGPFNANQKKTKKHRSWNEPFRFNSHRNSLKSATSEHTDNDQAGELLTSPTEPLKFDLVEISIPEEQCSDRRASSRSQSNKSSASADTITSVAECCNQASFANDSSSYFGEQNSLSKDLFPCKHCQRLSRESRRSQCSCNHTPCNTEIIITDTDSTCSYDASYVGTLKSKSTYHDPKNVTQAIQFVKSVSLDNLHKNDTITRKSNAHENVKFGGSLQALPNSVAQTEKIVMSITLPRRKCDADQMKLKLQSPDNSIVYASSPQLLLSKRGSFTGEAPLRKRGRPNSTSEAFPKIDTTSDVIQSQQDTDSARTRKSVVGSPIKRAIAYPGVVLRRHQNRRMKASNDEELRKSSSSDYLSSEHRAKQVLSLNVEDLPTYEKMRDDPKWNTSSMSPSGAFSKRDVTISGDTGRARLRAAVLYHRYATHCTSSDDVNAIEFMLGDDQSYEDLNNMDDDEFLDMYLSGASADTSLRYYNRSSQSQETTSKRGKTIRKSVASIANLISTAKPGKQKLQRSSSFKESPRTAVKPYRPPGGGRHSDVISSSGSVSTPGRRSTGNVVKNRSSKLWRETFDHTGLDETELKRQEAIFELYQGDSVMVQDLKMAKQTYRDSMMTLKMLTADEVTRIFGKLDCLLPLHEDLLARLESARSENGRIDTVGRVFIDWFPTLSPYEEYCANQADAKKTLDAVVNREARVRDFLQRCLESPFSRKLNLWSYLDLPRSRLVKYPLLLKAILKATPPEHPDTPLLEKALEIINDIITRVDDLTGERKSKLVLSKLEYLDDKHRCKEVDESRKMICSGQLKNNRGTKLQVFLFDLALVLTRNATRSDKLMYQVYRRPLPLKSLVVETDEGGKLGGSFKGGLLSNDKAKHSFRVRSLELNTAYTLVANDEHDKKQWINSLLEAMNMFRRVVEPKAGESPLPRRGGSEKYALDKSVEKAAASVKRSSSMKSEGSGSSPWFRHRNMTINAKPVRRNSGDKRDLIDLKKKSRLSPLSIRRRSKPENPNLSKSSDVSLLTLEEELLIEEKNSIGRSRSLTSSPIAFLANLPRRNSRRGSALARSESCCLKPPSGRSQNSEYHRSGGFSVISQSPQRSITRSIPDLSNYDSLGMQRNEQFVLEEVRRRLAPTKCTSNVLKVPVKFDKSSTKSESSEEFPDSVSVLRKNSLPSLHSHHVSNHSMVSSISARNTANAREKNSSSPVYKTRTVTSCYPNFSSQTSTPTGIMALPLTPSSSLQLNQAGRKQHPASSSSESLDDVNSLSDDVAIILDEAGDNRNEENFHDDDVAPTNKCCTPLNTNDDVLDTLNDVIDRVCDMHRVVSYSDKMTVSCQDDYIILSCDDGLPWRGDDAEMMV